MSLQDRDGTERFYCTRSVPIHLDEGMRVLQDGRKLLLGKKLSFMGYMMSDSDQKKEYNKGMAK